MYKKTLKMAVDCIGKVDEYSLFESRSEINRYKKEWIYYNLALGLDILRTDILSINSYEKQIIYQKANNTALITIEAMFDSVREKNDLLKLRYIEFLKRQKEYNSLLSKCADGNAMRDKTAYYSITAAGISTERKGFEFFWDYFVRDNISQYIVLIDTFIQLKINNK